MLTEEDIYNVLVEIKNLLEEDLKKKNDKIAKRDDLIALANQIICKNIMVSKDTYRLLEVIRDVVNESVKTKLCVEELMDYLVVKPELTSKLIEDIYKQEVKSKL